MILLGFPGTNLVRHLGLFLYEYLGEEYPEVLGRGLRSPNDIDIFNVFEDIQSTA